MITGQRKDGAYEDDYEKKQTDGYRNHHVRHSGDMDHPGDIYITDFISKWRI